MLAQVLPRRVLGLFILAPEPGTTGNLRYLLDEWINLSYNLYRIPRIESAVNGYLVQHLHFKRNEVKGQLGSSSPRSAAVQELSDRSHSQSALCLSCTHCIALADLWLFGVGIRLSFESLSCSGKGLVSALLYTLIAPWIKLGTQRMGRLNYTRFQQCRHNLTMYAARVTKTNSTSLRCQKVVCMDHS